MFAQFWIFNFEYCLKWIKVVEKYRMATASPIFTKMLICSLLPTRLVFNDCNIIEKQNQPRKGIFKILKFIQYYDWKRDSNRLLASSIHLCYIYDS